MNAMALIKLGDVTDGQVKVIEAITGCRKESLVAIVKHCYNLWDIFSLYFPLRGEIQESDGQRSSLNRRGLYNKGCE